MSDKNLNTRYNSEIEDDEIDLIEILKTLWNGRKKIIKTTLIFMFIGLFVAIFSPKEFTASTTMVPATQGKSIGGNLGGLAAMAGINLGSMGGESGISPQLYPQIMNSVPFQLELLQTPITIEGLGKKITFRDYYLNYNSPGLLGYIKKYTIGLPSLILSVIKGEAEVNFNQDNEKSLLRIGAEENGLIKQLNSQVSLSVNDKDGYVSISANMPEAMASAQVAENAQNLLQQYIIDFKIQKSTEQLKFIQARYSEKEEEFKRLQQQLAQFQDQNQFSNSAQSKISLMRLQSEYDLAFNVYNELAKQLETQQIQVKEDTPVFTIIKPVTVPVEKSKPKRSLILLGFTFLGLIVGVGLIYGKIFYSDLKMKMSELKDED